MADAKPSKTERKREQQALKSLGEQLLPLGASQLNDAPIDDVLRDAVRKAQSMRAHGALRRQKGLIAKLMRDIDPQPIRDYLDRLSAGERLHKRVFADAERWRDRLIRERGEAVAEFEKLLGNKDQDLQILIAELARAVSDREEKTLRRKLFRHVHDALLTRAQSDRLSR